MPTLDEFLARLSEAERGNEPSPWVAYMDGRSIAELRASLIPGVIPKPVPEFILFGVEIYRQEEKPGWWVESKERRHGR